VLNFSVKKGISDGFHQFADFLISYKKENGIEWHQMLLDADRRNYHLDKLACGTAYVLHIAAINKVGKGKHSTTIAIPTKGSRRNSLIYPLIILNL